MAVALAAPAALLPTAPPTLLLPTPARCHPGRGPFRSLSVPCCRRSCCWWCCGCFGTNVRLLGLLLLRRGPSAAWLLWSTPLLLLCKPPGPVSGDALVYVATAVLREGGVEVPIDI